LHPTYKNEQTFHPLTNDEISTAEYQVLGALDFCHCNNK